MESSPELVLFRLVKIVRTGEFFDQGISIEPVRLEQIVERVAVIPELRVQETDEQVGIHLETVGKVHE
jgi:hypothetical protein